MQTYFKKLIRNNIRKNIIDETGDKLISRLYSVYSVNSHNRHNSAFNLYQNARGIRRFSTTIKEIKEKLNKEGYVKLYDSKYNFSSEKLLVQASGCFSIVFASTVFIAKVGWMLKIVNAIFLIPCALVVVEYFVNRTRFIQTIKILPDNKLDFITMWGKSEILEVGDMNKVNMDKRFEKVKGSLNDQTFIIVTNKKNDNLYHVPRDGFFLDEDLFHNLTEGKLI